MTAKSNPNEQDQALAAYTDALLEGQDLAPGTLPDELTAAVDRLAQALPPVDPPEALRRRIQRQVRGAWEETHAPWWSDVIEAWRGLCRGLGRSLSRRPAWGALAALILVGFLVTLVIPGGQELTGTAVSPATEPGPGAGWWVLPVAVVVAAVVIRLIRRR